MVIALGLSTQGFAAQNPKMTHDKSHSCDNYYVQPGGVYIAPNGIFVLIGEKLTQVNILCSDEGGVFVPYEEMTRRFVRCPFCNGWYDPENPESHDCPGFPED